MDVTSLAQRAVEALRHEVGEDLHSCCLYGSSVRGDARDYASDINLLIVLRTSQADTHAAVARAIGGEPRIDPFILGLPGFERSVRAFAAKFASIQRFYRVLHGADPLARIIIAPALERFLCEQALRNLRLRVARAFVTRQQHRRYGEFLARSVTPLLLRLSEILRLEGVNLPVKMPERVDAIATRFGMNAATLTNLLVLRDQPREFDDAEALTQHRRIFDILNTAAAWIESRWPASVELA